MEKNKNNGIYKPKQRTFYIARYESGAIESYGSVEKNLVWTTKYKDFKTFVEKQDWLDELLDNGITPIEDLMPFN
jgi:hypothetical protein